MKKMLLFAVAGAFLAVSASNLRPVAQAAQTDKNSHAEDALQRLKTDLPAILQVVEN